MYEQVYLWSPFNLHLVTIFYESYGPVEAVAGTRLQQGTRVFALLVATCSGCLFHLWRPWVSPKPDDIRWHGFQLPINL